MNEKMKIIATQKLCRDCLNTRYTLRLNSADCYYWSFPSACRGCGEIRNIVTGIPPLRRWKLWFKKI